MNSLPPQPDDLRLEVARLLASPMFSHSDAMRRLLAYLAEKAAAGQTEGLKEFTIGVEAFHKPSDYSPQEDPTVRVVASKLRRRLDEYYATEGAARPYRIEIPKGHYGLRLAPQTEAVAPQVSSAARRWRRISMVLAAALVLSLIALAWDDLRTHNVILLGSPKFIVQLKDFPYQQSFVIDSGAVRNLQPQPGEPAAFRGVRTPSHSAILEDFALITRLPGLQGRGCLDILGSTSTEGTWAAADYVTAAGHVSELVKRLRLPSGKLPDAFQVVIRAKFKDMVPVESSYVSHRVLESPRPGPLP